MSTWNYLKAQRLNENLLFNCSKISSLPLAQFMIDMRKKFNLLNETWWPILVGVSSDTHNKIIDVLKTRYQLHGAHLYAWETRENTLNTQDLILICANHGETLYELDPNMNYIVQIDADERQCCLGHVTDENKKFYKNIVKLESRRK